MQTEISQQNINGTILQQFSVIYIQVTVHRDNLRTNNQQNASSIQNFILS